MYSLGPERMVVRGAGLPRQRNGGLHLCICLHAVGRDLQVNLPADLQGNLGICMLIAWHLLLPLCACHLYGSMNVVCVSVICACMTSPHVFFIKWVILAFPCLPRDLWAEVSFVQLCALVPLYLLNKSYAAYWKLTLHSH